MKSALFFAALSFLAGSTTAVPAPTTEVKANFEHGTCSVHLDVAYSFDPNSLDWTVKASVFDNAHTLTGNVTYKVTLTGGVYDGLDVGLDKDLYLLAWRNNTGNVALLQYGSYVIEAGAPGTSNEQCTNGPLVDYYKVESDCTFPC